MPAVLLALSAFTRLLHSIKVNIFIYIHFGFKTDSQSQANFYNIHHIGALIPEYKYNVYAKDDKLLGIG